MVLPSEIQSDLIDGAPDVCFRRGPDSHRGKHLTSALTMSFYARCAAIDALRLQYA